MNHTRQTARLATLGMVFIGALSWPPSSHSQMLQATVPAATARATITTNARAPARLKAAYAQLPLSFEENRGQTSDGVRFLSRGNGYMLFLTQSEMVLALLRSHNSEGGKSTSDLQGSDAVCSSLLCRQARFRTRCFCTCLGSLTARDPSTPRAGGAPGVAFRVPPRRREYLLFAQQVMYFTAQYQPVGPPCQRFDAALAGDSA